MKEEIRELNAPAIDLIADILDKHVDAILGEVRIRFKQIKSDQSSEPAEPVSKTDWNSELSSWSGEDFIRIFHERPDLADRLRKMLADQDEERLAMKAVMESVDPAAWPGLTPAQRCALGRFAKPQPAESVAVPSGTKEDTSGG